MQLEWVFYKYVIHVYCIFILLAGNIETKLVSFFIYLYGKYMVILACLQLILTEVSYYKNLS